MVREPADSDPWLPVIDKINEVLGGSTAPEPPTRDIDGYLTRARKTCLPGMHLFTSANEPDDAAGSLPPPEQWLLQRMGEIEVAELIERHIDYVNAKDESVHLRTAFVKHYVRRYDDVLPLVVAIATLPIVLGDGTLLAPAGFDRKRGIIFKVPKELRNVLPRREGCDDAAVREAMRFLCDDWLCDVAADYTGKCIHIAAALTMIERSLVPERPTFSVTAGKSGGGKTTLFKMLIMAVTGQQAAAAAWSSDENERRKALVSYLLAGVPYILWDNIPRGERLSCPHIERSCTTPYYTDRQLGVTEMVTVAAAAIHFFTGNNVVPVGDLAARDLHTRLAVDRPDPQNRDFRHPDPVGWTERNRAEILASLYTVLLGNPMLRQPSDAAGHTRFKVWYRLVGSALEHAARCASEKLDFRKLFVANEEDDEEGTTLAAALEVMTRRWPGEAEFKGSHIASLINREGATSDRDPDELEQLKHDSATLRDFLLSDVPANTTATAIAISRKLSTHVDEPVQYGGQTLVLRTRTVHKMLHYFVTKIFDRPEPPPQGASKPAGAGEGADHQRAEPAAGFEGGLPEE
jgi:hypothetical protein